MKQQPESVGEAGTSNLALGCEVLGGTDWGTVDLEAAVETVTEAYRGGIAIFDTADVYGLGRSEELLAESLGDLRTEVTICSKFGVNWHRPMPGTRARTFRDCRPLRVHEALDASLRRLRLECLPLYLMHWPDPSIPIADTMAALGRCQEQGKVMSVGVSNCSPEQIRQAHAVLPLSAVQLPVSLITARASSAAIQCCRELGIKVMGYGPLAQGLLTGKYREDIRFGPDDRRHRLPHFSQRPLASCQPAIEHLRQLGERYGKSAAQLALRWALDYPGVTTVVVGARTPRQLQENLGALGWKLAPREWASLGEVWGDLFRPGGDTAVDRAPADAPPSLLSGSTPKPGASYRQPTTPANVKVGNSHATD